MSTVHCTKCNKEMHGGVEKEEILEKVQAENPGLTVTDALPVCEECFQNLMHETQNVSLRIEQIVFIKSVMAKHLSDISKTLNEDAVMSQYEKDKLMRTGACFADIMQTLSIPAGNGDLLAGFHTEINETPEIAAIRRAKMH